MSPSDRYDMTDAIAAGEPTERPINVDPVQYQLAERRTLAELDMVDVFELASAYKTLLARASSAGTPHENKGN